MWPKNGNPEIARSLPRQRSLPIRAEIETTDSEYQTMAFNGIIYNNLLHEQEVDVEPSQLISALESFCEEFDIELNWRKLNASLGRGGIKRGGIRTITLDPHGSGPYRLFRTFVHEIVHAVGHSYYNARGYLTWNRNLTRPVKEAEAYLVESRVYSFFCPSVTNESVEPDIVKTFNDRLYWYGPKRNIHTIREEQCVEFADNLILWIIDHLSAKGVL